MMTDLTSKTPTTLSLSLFFSSLLSDSPRRDICNVCACTRTVVEIDVVLIEQEVLPTHLRAKRRQLPSVSGVAARVLHRLTCSVCSIESQVSRNSKRREEEENHGAHNPPPPPSGHTESERQYEQVCNQQSTPIFGSHRSKNHTHLI
jgi:hypothetical protein